MTKFASWKIALVALAMAVGCGGNGTTPDAGGEARDAAGPSLPVLTTGTMASPTTGTPDLACIGSRARPTAGAPVDTTFELRDFESDSPVSNARVWFFGDNVVRATCDAPSCTEVTTDASGNAAVDVPSGGWYAYRVFPRPGATAAMSVIDSMQYNEPAPTAGGGSVTANSVSEGTLALIPAVVNILRQPGTALLAGVVQDCNETPMYGAIVRVFDGDTELVEGERVEQPHYRYFNGDSFPSDSSTFTHADGLYVGIQIPVPAGADDQLRVEAWGRPTEGEAPRRIGCEAVRVLPNAVTIINIGPERSDYPVGHPCAE
ncbi:MAG: hypothetical protein M3Y87_37250 [Myxococcota bacterium]|nr:hypothetical protein [Myxococcota bacterium]